MAEIFTHNVANAMMSSATAAHFGAWAQEFPIWLDTQGIKATILITPEDILGGKQSDELSTGEKTQALKTFIEENFPDFPLDQFDDRRLSSVANHIADGNGMAEDIDINNDGLKDYGIIALPHRIATKEELAGRLGDIPPEDITNVHGTDLEWQVMIAAHEIGHHSQPGKTLRENLIWEIEAEDDMVTFMRAAHEKGLVSDPAMLDELTKVRNLKSFFFKSDLYTHVLSPAVRTPSEGPAPVHNDDLIFQDALHEALMKVSYEIGQDLITGDHKKEALDNMLRERGIYSFGERRLPDMDRESRKIIFEISKGERGLEDGLKDLPQDIQDKIHENFHGETEIIGIKELKDNPALMYETTRQFYLQGAFDDNPIGKQYAYEFLSAAQQFAAQTFGVSDIAEHFEPPVFEESQDHTPTRDKDLSHTLLHNH